LRIILFSKQTGVEILAEPSERGLSQDLENPGQILTLVELWCIGEPPKVGQ